MIIVIEDKLNLSDDVSFSKIILPISKYQAQLHFFFVKSHKMLFFWKVNYQQGKRFFSKNMLHYGKYTLPKVSVSSDERNYH